MRRVSHIIDTVAAITALSSEDIKGHSRHRIYIRARMAVTHYARLEGWSYDHIGRFMGGRDHSTIYNQQKKAKIWAGRDPMFDRIIRRAGHVLSGDVAVPVAEYVNIPKPKRKPAPDKHEVRLMAALSAAHHEVMSV